MARGDPTFMKVDIDILDGEHFGQLTGNERDTFLFGYWGRAIRYRCDRLHGFHVVYHLTSKILRKNRKTIAEHTEKFLRLGLLIEHPDGSITVKGVKRCHRKLHWREYPYASPSGEKPVTHTGKDVSPYGPPSSREQERGEGRGEESYTSSSNKPSSLLTPTPPESGKEGVHYRGRTPEGSPDPLDPKMIISDPEKISALALEISTDLTTPDETLPELEELIAHFPATWIADARSATLDKIHAIAEGKTEEFTKGPLEYFAGILDRRRR